MIDYYLKKYKQKYIDYHDGYPGHTWQRVFSKEELREKFPDYDVPLKYRKKIIREGEYNTHNLFINDQYIKFPSGVEEALEINDLLIIRTLGSKEEENRNVYAYNEKGGRTWQIQSSNHRYGRVFIKNNGKLYASNSNYRPIVYLVDHENGDIFFDEELYWR